MEQRLEYQLGELIRKKRMKLAVAESCTGGLISDRITDVPGSSDYFMGGIVAYAYEAKSSLLNVPWDVLQVFGAVSRETVLEMARGARRVLKADISASVSGIAGPGGGTAV
jgi:PncC family amidohydrolase